MGLNCFAVSRQHALDQVQRITSVDPSDPWGRRAVPSGVQPSAMWQGGGAADWGHRKEGQTCVGRGGGVRSFGGGASEKIFVVGVGGGREAGCWNSTEMGQEGVLGVGKRGSPKKT